MRRSTLAGVALALLLGACKKEAPPPLYQAVPVIRKDIYVSAQASGAIEPILMVDVKSRASGTILEMRAQTGQTVRQGDTLVLVDKRDPTNTLNQAEADLAVAQAQLANAEATKRRTDAMFQTQLVSEQEHEAANLTYANARAQLVRAQTSVQTARDAMDDTSVRAPVSGTIIAKNVEVGNVIASATRDVTGGVVLLKMADLTNVQIRTLVDETDIGKIYPGMQASITVDAYPNQPFTGTVLKVEPQSVVNQNVTMFPVLIQIPNEDGRLKPGMNTEVQVQVSQRNGVLAIPNAALRTPRDVSSAAMVLGLDPAQVQQTLARADSQAAREAPAQANAGGNETAGSMAGSTPPVGGRPDGSTKADTSRRRDRGQGGQGGQGGAQRGQGGPGGGFQRGQGGQGGAPGGFQRGQGGQGGAPGGFQRGQGGGMGGGGFAGGPRRTGMGGSYIVFAMRGGRATPVRIRTGVTDLDYTEVVRGLTEQDTVLLLPSASLLQSQQDMKDRMTRMTGGGVPGMKQQAAPTPSQGATQGGGGGRRGP